MVPILFKCGLFLLKTPSAIIKKLNYNYLTIFPDFSMIIGMRRKVKTFFARFYQQSVVPQTSYYAKILKSKFGISSLLYSFILLSLVTGVVFCPRILSGRTKIQYGKYKAVPQRLFFFLNEIPSSLFSMSGMEYWTNHELPLLYGLTVMNGSTPGGGGWNEG